MASSKFTAGKTGLTLMQASSFLCGGGCLPCSGSKSWKQGPKL